MWDGESVSCGMGNCDTVNGSYRIELSYTDAASQAMLLFNMCVG